MKYLNQPILIAAAAVITGGCSSAPARFYTLKATATRVSPADASYGVIVGPVFMPASVDRPQFVVETAPNRVEIEEFNRWDAPLGDSIARVVSVDLGALLGTVRVATAPMPDFGPAYHVTIRVERFVSVRATASGDGEAVLDARWTVRDPKDGSLVSGVFTVTEPAPGGSFDALAAAHSRALAKLSADIAVAFRSVAK
jgi:hypothetical protein